MSKFTKACAVLLCVIAGGCQSGNLPDDPKSTSSSKANPSTAREVNRYEFVESELVPHPEDETEFNHYYMGSRDGYDFITVRSHTYKIPTDQLNLKNSFPLTKDDKKWTPLRIHFSHVEYPEDPAE
jgi:hypothetical protein